MPREAKSANSDYGSFCATPEGLGTPPSGGLAIPPSSAEGAPSSTPYQRVETNSADQADNSIISGVSNDAIKNMSSKPSPIRFAGNYFY